MIRSTSSFVPYGPPTARQAFQVVGSTGTPDLAPPGRARRAQLRLLPNLLIP
ncbi:hypothetical protein ACFV6F_37395 [Kitasatospora phosalacinea]|uniref:hypothetical protein n=1 Tax=Kitasatospora phosalacinea TaxID=2065 RepID=UPI00366756B9